MDNKKDNRDISVHKESYLLNSVFIKDTQFQYIFKKTEKIVTAVYLVSNFFSTQEPLKWSLRNSATSLLKSAMSFSKSSLSDREIKVHDLNSSILELSSLFDLAYNSGFISPMNYNILNSEISKLSAQVASYNSNGISANKSLFDEEYFFVRKMEESDKGHDLYKGQSNVFYNTKSDNSVKTESKVVAEKPKQKKVIKKTNTDRRERILSEIRSKVEVSVKDIARVVTDCSEKTLQRELLSMVDDGLLEKKGERRWSRYTIKK